MAKPKLALIPSTVGGSVYSVLPSNGDGDFDFSRASAATRINAQGLIETVAVGDNRLNYPLLDGTVQTCPHLLLEGQRTNLITYSESFSNAYWTKSGASITSNAAISPDGTLNADKLVEDSANSTHFISVNNIFTADGSLRAWSLFVKEGEKRYIFITNVTTINNDINCVVFDTRDGVFTNTSGLAYIVTRNVQALENGWHRIDFTNNVNSGSYDNFYIGISSTSNMSGASYQGDGTSGVYIYGAQIELGSYSTSYIVSNSGSATTRLAEVCDGSGNASTFNDSEGVLMVQAGALANDGTFRFISLSDDSLNNVVWIYYRSEANQINFRVIVGGVPSFDQIYTINDATRNAKLALKYKENDFSAWVNGFKVFTDTSGSIFPIGTLKNLEFNRPDDTNFFYGKTKQLQYFDSALTDSELETLTSWMSFSDMAIDLNYTIQ